MTVQTLSSSRRLLWIGSSVNLPLDPDWDVSRINDPLHALGALRGGGAYDAMVVQLPLPDWTPEEWLEESHRAASAVPCVFTGVENLPLPDLMRLVKLGAFHYLPADTPVEQVQQAIEQAFDYRDRVRRNDSAETWRHILVGNGAAMQTILETVRLVAQRRSTVLITGETGTGKEMVARAIHAASNRAHLQMVAVNCSALPENLLEAELFGHVKGAFTGAIQHRVGRFEQANNSTIFLDEIAEMPLDLQTKLLRVLQEREFQRLGSSDSVKVDVRVIAACNVDPLESIRLGKFREDLYYRLNVVPIQVPSLRERLSDVPVLVHHFLEKICRHEGISTKKVSDETIDRLSRYSWPGNVRQLENAVEMAVALSGDRDTLYPGDFPLPSVAARKLPQPALPTQIAMPEDGIDFEHVIGTIERNLLDQALRRSNGNKKAAAELLRLKRTTLTAKLKSLETRVAC